MGFEDDDLSGWIYKRKVCMKLIRKRRWRYDRSRDIRWIWGFHNVVFKLFTKEKLIKLIFSIDNKDLKK
jgi:hypothetical protein